MPCNKPSDRLYPIFELIVSFWCDLEGGTCRQDCVGELFIVCDSQMIQLGVNALNVPIEISLQHFIKIPISTAGRRNMRMLTYIC